MTMVEIPLPASPAPPPGASEPAVEPPAADSALPPADPAKGGSAADSGAPPPAEDPALVAEREKLARAKAAGERAKQDAARRRQREAAEAQQRAELAAIQSERDALLKERQDWAIARDPARSLEERGAAFQRLGISGRDMAQAALREGTPEAQLEALLDKRVGPLMSELQTLRAWKQEQDAQRAAAARETGYQELTKLVADKARFPSLAGQPPWVVLAAAQQVWANIPPAQRAGVTDADVLEYLEEEYAAHAKSAVTTTPPTVDPKTAPGPNENAGSATPRTVTQDTAPPRTPASVDWDSMTLEEQKAEIARQLREKAGKATTKK